MKLKEIAKIINYTDICTIVDDSSFPADFHYRGPVLAIPDYMMEREVSFISTSDRLYIYLVKEN